MDIDELRQHFPDETSCRLFFETMIWSSGRTCPHCGSIKSWKINGQSARDGLFECGSCGLQFTVTTKTPMHSTKLPLWTWLTAMYLIASSSKGISSVVLGRLIGTTQKTAWKLGHAIRAMMAAVPTELPLLMGVVELDEKYLGGSPRFQEGVKHKCGSGTAKQCIAVAVEREGSVKATLVPHNGETALGPFVRGAVGPDAYLMSDHNQAYVKIGECFAGHSYVDHGRREYARGEVHNNTAESYNAILERAKIGVFHFMSKEHMQRYVDEVSFRWNQRVPDGTRTRKGKEKVVMKSLPVIIKIQNLLRVALNIQLRWTANSSIYAIA
jgi:transposase-like protein